MELSDMIFIAILIGSLAISIVTSILQHKRLRKTIEHNERLISELEAEQIEHAKTVEANLEIDDKLVALEKCAEAAREKYVDAINAANERYTSAKSAEDENLKALQEAIANCNKQKDIINELSAANSIVDTEVRKLIETLAVETARANAATEKYTTDYKALTKMYVDFARDVIRAPDPEHKSETTVQDVAKLDNIDEMVEFIELQFKILDIEFKDALCRLNDSENELDDVKRELKLLKESNYTGYVEEVLKDTLKQREALVMFADRDPDWVFGKTFMGPGSLAIRSGAIADGEDINVCMKMTVSEKDMFDFKGLTSDASVYAMIRSNMILNDGPRQLFDQLVKSKALLYNIAYNPDNQTHVIYANLVARTDQWADYARNDIQL